MENEYKVVKGNNLYRIKGDGSVDKLGRIESSDNQIRVKNFSWLWFLFIIGVIIFLSLIL